MFFEFAPRREFTIGEKAIGVRRQYAAQVGPVSAAAVGGMTSRQSIALSVSRWSAWAPGVVDRQAWLRWAEGSTPIAGSVSPDVGFVTPMLRRRLSPLSRMAFRVAADCHGSDDESVAYVFCSRYGEYRRSFDLLESLAKKQPASAAAFSMSVHNTAGSLFAIERHDTASSTAIAGGEATLESGFLEAWSLLTDGAASTVLLVYHDEPLPALYQDQASTVHASVALALRLQLPESATQSLNLAWEATPEPPMTKPLSDPALHVVKLLLNQGERVVSDTGRLQWTWSTSAEPA